MKLKNNNGNSAAYTEIMVYYIIFVIQVKIIVRVTLIICIISILISLYSSNFMLSKFIKWIVALSFAKLNFKIYGL